jgi:DNA-binding GntR family transcriptional regulator
VAIEGLSLDQSSAAEQVANALRDFLLRGEIGPGVRLREVPLAAAIGVSRHTLRSGFRILEAEGLLEHALHRGVVVAELSDARVADVYRAKRALELAGLRAFGPEPASHPSFVRMVEAVDRMRRARSDEELGAADLEFHTAAVSAIDSRLIDHLYRNIQMQIRLTHAWASRSRGSKAQMVATHGDVVDLLRDAELEPAVVTLTEIIGTGEQRLLDAMSRNQRSPKSAVEAWPADDASFRNGVDGSAGAPAQQGKSTTVGRSG